MPVESNNRLIRLGEYREVKRTTQDPSSYKMRFNGSPAIAVGVVMSSGGNALELGEAMDMKSRAFAPNFLWVCRWIRSPFNPSGRGIGDRVHSLFPGSLGYRTRGQFLSLGFRTGIVVAMSVPLVLSITLLVMYIMDMNLDRISLGSLIIALGLWSMMRSSRSR